MGDWIKDLRIDLGIDESTTRIEEDFEVSEDDLYDLIPLSFFLDELLGDG